MTTMAETEDSTSTKPPGAPVTTHPEAVPLPKKKSKLVPIAITVLVAGAVTFFGYKFWEHASTIQETDDAVIAGRIHQVSTRVGGTVTKLLADDNQEVKQGQTIIQIDPRDFQISAETARAAALQAEWKTAEAQSQIITNQKQANSQRFQALSAVASANAQVDRMKSILSETRLGVSLAKAQIKQREAELTRCIADYERYKSLVADRAATQQSFDRAQQDKEVAEANLESAKENYKQAVLRISQAQQAVEDAKANVIKAKGMSENAEAAAAETEMSKKTLVVQQSAAQKAKSELANATTQLSYTNVVAPVSGRVGHRTVEVGQQVERGQALMSIVSDEKWVVAHFKETQLDRMRPGQEVDIKVDAFPKAHFKGVVDSISPASGAQFALLPPDNATGNFTKVVQRMTVKILFKKESLKGYENLLAPGMSVLPEVHVGEK